MNVRPFKTCCKKTAIQAFMDNTYYLIGCQFCGTSFSITHDLQHFIQQILDGHKMNSPYPPTYDVVAFNGQIIFMLP